MRAFDQGWGGAVWKTLGKPIRNVSSRFGAVNYGTQRMMGLNNIELITDRSLDVNLREIAETKKRFPGHALIVSLMVETKDEWCDLIQRSQDAGADGLELNFGCPHGMCERGMGSAVGQEPQVLREITSWAVDFAKVPVIVKMTPNIGDILEPGRAAVAGGAQAISCINTIKSIVGIDLKTFIPSPGVGDASTNGGYCGPAVKPIALHMVSQLARSREITIPISAIGGISNWRDAAEFLALGASNVQICTAVMHYGFRIIDDLCAGLSNYLTEMKINSVADLVGRAVPQFVEWGDLDLNHHVVAKISEDKCIGCHLCYVACLDGSHQCIYLPGMTKEQAQAAGHEQVPAEINKHHSSRLNNRVPWVDETECVGCNLCQLVCPVDDCIEMVTQRKSSERWSWHNQVDRACQN